MRRNYFDGIAVGIFIGFLITLLMMWLAGCPTFCH